MALAVIAGTTYFAIGTSQQAGSKNNSTQLIKCGRIDVEQFLMMERECRACKAQN